MGKGGVRDVATTTLMGVVTPTLTPAPSPVVVLGGGGGGAAWVEVVRVEGGDVDVVEVGGAPVGGRGELEDIVRDTSMAAPDPPPAPPCWVAMETFLCLFGAGCCSAVELKV